MNIAIKKKYVYKALESVCNNAEYEHNTDEIAYIDLNARGINKLINALLDTIMDYEKEEIIKSLGGDIDDRQSY